MPEYNPGQIRERLYEAYEESLFKLAIFDASEEEGRSLLEENERLKEDTELSPSAQAAENFRKQLDARMKRLRVYKRNRRASVVLRRTAVATAAIAVVFTTLLFTVDALRVKVLNLWLDIQPEYTSFELKDADGNPPGGGTSAEWTDAYAPTYIPEGYRIEKTHAGETYKRIFFVSEQNENSTIMYMDTGASSKTAIDTENAVMKTVQINGRDGTLIVKKPMVAVVWDMDNHMFTVLAQECSEEEVLKIAEGVQLIK